MLRTTAGRLFVNEALPEDMRDYSMVLDKGGAEKLFERLATTHPEHYDQSSRLLVKLARRAVTETQYSTFQPSNFFKSKSAQAIQKKINDEIRTILADDQLTDAQRNQKIIQILGRHNDALTQSVFEDSRREKNPFYWQISSGARGNPIHVNMLRGSPLLYVDHQEKLIPLPVLNSFSDGMSSMEFLASSFGARRGMVASKLMVQDAGFLGKQLNQLAHRMVISGHDSDPPKTVRGMLVSALDPDNEGAALAADMGPYKRNTILTPEIIKDLVRRGFTRLLVRSPIVGGAPDGGLYAMDVGLRENGKLPSVGTIVGLQAAQAVSEPISQGQLCLDKDTLVLRPDGSVFRLEEARIGDLVLGCDRSGRLFPTRILRVYDNGLRDCWKFRFGEGESAVEIVATLDHKVLCPTREAFAVVPLELANSIYTADGVVLKKTSQTHLGQRRTLDIEVDSDDHLFVLANRMVVSNSAKHTGGVVGQEKMVSGFSAINQLFQLPERLQSGATHSTVDGTVTSVRQAPAGGYDVYISGKRHYVAPNLKVLVKPGDKVEAGDVISEGVPHPGVLARYKGIGEARRQFVDILRQTLERSGTKVHRRHLEILARAMLNHVSIKEPWEDFLPEDIVPYSTIENLYQPREDSRELRVSDSEGFYLEEPVLHYTIGTRVTPSVIKELKAAGVEKIRVHKEPPPFEPEPIRAMESLRYDPDWMTRMYGSYLQSGLIEAVHKGLITDETGSSFVPGLAKAINFGRVGLIRRPETTQIPLRKAAFAPSPPTSWSGVKTRLTGGSKDSSPKLELHGPDNPPSFGNSGLGEFGKIFGNTGWSMLNEAGSSFPMVGAFMPFLLNPKAALSLFRSGAGPSYYWKSDTPSPGFSSRATNVRSSPAQAPAPAPTIQAPAPAPTTQAPASAPAPATAPTAPSVFSGMRAPDPTQVGSINLQHHAARLTTPTAEDVFNQQREKLLGGHLSGAEQWAGEAVKYLNNDIARIGVPWLAGIVAGYASAPFLTPAGGAVLGTTVEEATRANYPDIVSTLNRPQLTLTGLSLQDAINFFSGSVDRTTQDLLLRLQLAKQHLLDRQKAYDSHIQDSKELYNLRKKISGPSSQRSWSDWLNWAAAESASHFSTISEPSKVVARYFYDLMTPGVTYGAGGAQTLRSSTPEEIGKIAEPYRIRHKSLYDSWSKLSPEQQSAIVQQYQQMVESGSSPKDIHQGVQYYYDQQGNKIPFSVQSLRDMLISEMVVKELEELQRLQQQNRYLSPAFDLPLSAAWNSVTKWFSDAASKDTTVREHSGPLYSNRATP